MFKAKPASLRRKSFGGQTGIGIWWRKSSSPSNILSEEDEEVVAESRSLDIPSDTSISSASSRTEAAIAKKGEATTKQPLSPCIRTADEATIVGWDDDLCRPIYHRSENRSNTIVLVDSFDDELVRAVSSSDSGLAEATETDACAGVLDEEISESIQNASNVEQMKSSFPETLEANENDQDKSAADAPFRIPALPRKRTRTFGNRAKRQRPLSLVLTHEEEEIPLSDIQDARRVSLDSTEETTVSNARSEEQPKKGRRSKKARPNDSSKSLEKAREYFETLDQTTLTLDATLSPTVSSKVTRTSRRTSLASPGITREYEAYAESIMGDGSSGISPLSKKDYISSRKLHFQSKGELVDGFLDD